MKKWSLGPPGSAHCRLFPVFLNDVIWIELCFQSCYRLSCRDARARLPGCCMANKLKVHAIRLYRKYVLMTFAPLCDLPFLNYPTLPSSFCPPFPAISYSVYCFTAFACPINLPVRTVTQQLCALFWMRKMKAWRILSLLLHGSGEQSMLPSYFAYRQFWRRAISPYTETQKYKHTSSILIPIPPSSQQAASVLSFHPVIAETNNVKVLQFPNS